MCVRKRESVFESHLNQLKLVGAMVESASAMQGLRAKALGILEMKSTQSVVCLVYTN